MVPFGHSWRNHTNLHWTGKYSEEPCLLFSVIKCSLGLKLLLIRWCSFSIIYVVCVFLRITRNTQGLYIVYAIFPSLYQGYYMISAKPDFRFPFSTTQASKVILLFQS